MYENIDTRTCFELSALLERIRYAQEGISDRTSVMVSINVDPRSAQLDPARIQRLMSTLGEWGAISIQQIDKGSVVKEDREEAPTLTYHLEINLNNFEEAEKEIRSRVLLEEEVENRTPPQPISSVEFNDKKASVAVNGCEVKLPPNGNEHCLLRAMFDWQVEEPVDWSCVWKQVLGVDPLNDFDKEGTKKALRSARDTARNLNQRIKDKANVNDNLLQWEDKSITRKYG